MAGENLLERTLTMMRGAGERAPGVTINPIVDVKPISPSTSLEIGLTIPSLEALPQLNISSNTTDMEGFELLGVVGEGGMGVIELALQKAMQREVVIKRPRDIDSESNSMRALIKEGILTGRLEHPNIIPVHFLGRTAEGLPSLVMKRIKGTNWRELIHNPEHPMWEKVQGDRLAWHLRVMLQVANAIDFAHSQGILHRDIKTENVMLGHFGEVYVLDWGIGIKLDDENEARPAQFAGTPLYMAPEMLGGVLTPRTDIFLLGATLHEVLTQSPRHKGDDIHEVIFYATRCKPYDYGPDIPEELADICNRATHRDPMHRFPDAAAFREAIETHLQHRGAIELVRTADARLAQMHEHIQQAYDPLDTRKRLTLHELATECRFALREALKIWPEALHARQKLRDSTLLMLNIELDLGNIRNAELLIAELEDVPEDLGARLEELRAAEARVSEDQARLRSVEHNLDVNVGMTLRARLMVWLVMLTIGSVISIYIVSGKFANTTHVGSFFTGLGLYVACILVGLYYRKVLLQTVLNRHITAYFYGVFGFVVITRGLGFFIDISVEAVFVINMLFVAMGFLLASVTIQRALTWATLPFVISATIALFIPKWASPLLIGATILSAFIVGLIWSIFNKSPAIDGR